MSLTGGLDRATRAATPWPQWFVANVRLGLAALARPPCTPIRPAWRSRARIAVGALCAIAAVVATMALLDGRAIAAARLLPVVVKHRFGDVTEYGQAQWILVPCGIVLVLIAALTSPRLTRISQLVMASLAVRFGYVFLAVGLPGLFVTIVKRVIARARPPASGVIDPFLYGLFVWRPDYASLPSGHSTNVFAALVAVGTIWPRLRPVMWIYALIIAASRIVIQVHYPSDVLAGAIVGTVGAWLVRDWFAARRLAFTVDANGRVHALTGPSFGRLRRVARAMRSRA